MKRHFATAACVLAFSALAQAPPPPKELTRFVAAAKGIITANFKDPEGARFRNLHVSLINNEAPVLCGEINAKNSYGAFVGYRPFYVTEIPGLAQIAKEGEDPTFATMNPKLCGKKFKSVN